VTKKRSTAKAMAATGRIAYKVDARTGGRQHGPTGQSQHPSKSLIEAARELNKDVDEVTPVDLLEYQREDLPDGPASPLGGEQPSHLRSEPESETRRLAEVGRRRVDRSLQARHKRRRELPAT
jgi:hypothetical protein